MTYRILSTKQFEKDFRKLDGYTRLKIKEKFLEVALNPMRYKHMHPPLNAFCRIRIGKLRVLFSYNVEKRILYLEKVVFGHQY